MTIAFILFVLAIAIIAVFGYKRAGYSIPVSILLGVVFIICGLAVLLIKTKIGNNSGYHYSLYDSVGVIGLELCACFIPALIINFIITNRITKKVSNTWTCPNCGQENPNTMTVCDCGEKKPDSI